MTIFGAILHENEREMSNFSQKSRGCSEIGYKWGTVRVHVESEGFVQQLLNSYSAATSAATQQLLNSYSAATQQLLSSYSAATHHNYTPVDM